MNENMKRTSIGSESAIDQDDFVAAIFQRAQSQAPVLSDENFTKMVMNQLPSRPKRQRSKRTLLRWLPDSLGVLAGLGVMSLVVGPTQISNTLASLAPSAITLSSTSVIAVAAAFACLSVVAFWRVEQS